MGTRFADQFSLLHFAAGVVAYFFGIPFLVWVILNLLFEIAENSPQGIRLINSFSFWPGGKPYPDSLINIIGDIFFIILGWGAAYLLDYLGDRYRWYIH